MIAIQIKCTRNVYYITQSIYEADMDRFGKLFDRNHEHSTEGNENNHHICTQRLLHWFSINVFGVILFIFFLHFLILYAICVHV